jgi:hypothetical protein
MDKLTRILLTTAFAGAMGITGLGSLAYAQDNMGAPKDAPPMLQLDDNGGQRGDHGPRDDRRGGRDDARGGIAGLICSTDGATTLETKLGDLSTALKLTTTQQPLFDAYKTAALSAQTTFAATCPQPPAAPATDAQPATPPDAVTVLKDRVTRETAELDALNAVLPSFEALYNSLDDTQKAALMPLVGPHHGPHDDRGGDRGDRAGRHDDRAGRHDDRGGNRGGDDRGDEPGRGGDKGRH